MERIEYMQQMRSRDLQKTDLEIMKIQAEANILNAKSDKEKSIAILIDGTIKNIDAENLPDEFKFLIINALINPTGKDYTEDFIKNQPQIA